MMQRPYTIVPQTPTGYILDERDGFFSVVVPEETTNLVANPSFETNATGYMSAFGAAVARSTEQQRRGSYSYKITPGVGFGSGGAHYTIVLTAGTTYTFSVDVLGAAGINYLVAFAEATFGASLMATKFVGTGYWQRHAVSFTIPTPAAASYLLMVRQDAGTSVLPFYIDGLQCEAKAYPTTYTDGDQYGLLTAQIPAPYRWNGTPHASTSTRSILTRAGGRAMPLSKYGFRLLMIMGLGLPGVVPTATPYGLIDGAQYQRTSVPERPFTLAGVFEAGTLSQLQRDIDSLGTVLSPHASSVDQPLLLRYQASRCGVATSDELLIPCVYTGGLGGQTDSHHQERVALGFTMFLPYVRVDGNQAAIIGGSTAVAANQIIQKTGNGQWSILSTGLNQTGQALAYDASNNLYAGGNFTTAGGVAANYIAKWDGSAWSALGTGMNLGVLVIAIGPDGSVYAGGDSTTAGGIAANRIAKWNGSAWSALGTGMNAVVYALAFGPDGTLYAGGSFTTAGGVAASRVAKWNGSAWSALSTGMNGDVYALAVGPDGTVYAGGDFTTAGGVAAANVAKWNGSAWSALGAGTNNDISVLAVGFDGALYAGGVFTTAGGVSANCIAKWNGSAWSGLGTGITGASVAVNDIAFDRAGGLYVGGVITTAGGIDLPLDSGVAYWDGGGWIPADFYQLSDAGVGALAWRNDTLTVAYAPDSLVRTPQIATATTVENRGTARTYPKFIITGPGPLYQITNATTGKAIYFNGLTLNAGEVATLDLTPGNISFTSTFRPNLLGTIATGSTLADWFLTPGTNSIRVLQNAGVGASMVVQWVTQHLGINGATR